MSVASVTGIALYPYTKSIFEEDIVEGDLEVDVNDVITDIYVVNDDWYLGTLHGASGIIPSAFVSINCMFKTRVTFDYDANRDDEISLTKGALVDVYEDKGNGWFRVIANEVGGLFPSTHLRKMKIKKLRVKKRKTSESCGNLLESGVSKSVSCGNLARKRSPSVKATRKGKVINAYEAQHGGDLELQLGETIQVIKSTGAWWKGKTESGKTGIFPANCIEFV